ADFIFQGRMGREVLRQRCLVPLKCIHAGFLERFYGPAVLRVSRQDGVIVRVQVMDVRGWRQ
ncbi:hypothetical protein RA267_29600, partial [Pseudomonas syringae pv. tagetis]|uniref:hypothetical protein n=1 Tax=Pseudomonas syringae group genomosp. 7 TaxID=251699 RepID=UPI0037704F5D